MIVCTIQIARDGCRIHVKQIGTLRSTSIPYERSCILRLIGCGIMISFCKNSLNTERSLHISFEFNNCFHKALDFDTYHQPDRLFTFKDDVRTILAKWKNHSKVQMLLIHFSSYESMNLIFFFPVLELIGEKKSIYKWAARFCSSSPWRTWRSLLCVERLRSHPKSDFSVGNGQ